MRGGRGCWACGDDGQRRCWRGCWGKREAWCSTWGEDALADDTQHVVLCRIYQSLRGKPSGAARFHSSHASSCLALLFSWVKMGPAEAAGLLQAGCNDMGGVLMNESISRAAGASHGQELGPQAMDDLIRAAGAWTRSAAGMGGSTAARCVRHVLIRGQHSGDMVMRQRSPAAPPTWATCSVQRALRRMRPRLEAGPYDPSTTPSSRPSAAAKDDPVRNSVSLPS